MSRKVSDTRTTETKTKKASGGALGNGRHSAGRFEHLRVLDTYVSSAMLDHALDAIARRRTIQRQYDVPYLAGYSTDGKRVYIDRHLPETFIYKKQQVRVDRYLLLHEEVEKALIDEVGLLYQYAHQIATRAEEAAVRADGISWRAYDRFMQTYIKRMGDERLTALPPDLDLKPYRDEHDYELMQRMAASLTAAKRSTHRNRVLLKQLKDELARMERRSH